jgi:hypothetical protein
MLPAYYFYPKEFVQRTRNVMSTGVAWEIVQVSVAVCLSLPNKIKTVFVKLLRMKQVESIFDSCRSS